MWARGEALYTTQWDQDRVSDGWGACKAQVKENHGVGWVRMGLTFQSNPLVTLRGPRGEPEQEQRVAGSQEMLGKFVKYLQGES